MNTNVTIDPVTGAPFNPSQDDVTVRPDFTSQEEIEVLEVMASEMQKKLQAAKAEERISKAKETVLSREERIANMKAKLLKVVEATARAQVAVEVNAIKATKFTARNGGKAIRATGEQLVKVGSKMEEWGQVVPEDVASAIDAKIAEIKAKKA